MTSYLALLQFPFLYLTLLVVGFGVYGSQFDTLAGGIYIAFAVGLTGFMPFARKLTENCSDARLALITGFGVVCAIAAYRPMHLGYWDERSAIQALWLAGTGLSSMLVSFIGAHRVRKLSTGHRNAQAFALLCFGIVWLTAFEYAMLPLLLLAVVFALCCAVRGRETPTPKPEALAEIPAGWLGYGAFVVALDVGVMVFDFALVRAWAPHLAICFACAAAGLRISAGRPVAAPIFFSLGVINFVVATLHPPFALHPMHTVFAGFALGAVFARLLRDRYDPEGDERMLKNADMFWFLGLILSYVFMRNLNLLHWRIILVIPFLLLAVRKSVKRKQGSAVFQD